MVRDEQQRISTYIHKENKWSIERRLHAAVVDGIEERGRAPFFPAALSRQHIFWGRAAVVVLPAVVIVSSSRRYLEFAHPLLNNKSFYEGRSLTLSPPLACPPPLSQMVSAGVLQ